MSKLNFIACLTGLVCAQAIAGPNVARRIALDGRFDDWKDLPPAAIDPTGDNGKSAADIQGVWLANDDRYLYLWLQVGRLLNLQHIDTPLRLHFDLDRDPNTGYRVDPIGADLVILLPERRGAEEAAGQLEAIPLKHTQLGLTWEPTLASTEFEMRIDRWAVSPSQHAPVFSHPDFDLVITGCDEQGHIEEMAPNAPKPITYQFAEGAPPPYPATAIEKQKPEQIRLVAYNMLWGGLVKRPEYFDRILRALQPDVICFEEVGRSYQQREHSDVEISATTVGQRMDQIVPLGGDQRWQTHSHHSCVVASRWPLTMKSTDADVPFCTGVGQVMALVDLPDGKYARDLYVACAHYKCCGYLNSAEDLHRQKQSDGNIAWFRDLRTPGGRITLPTGTPFLICGDLNLVGGRQILDTLLTGNIIDQITYGQSSPPDWDGTELTDVRPLHNADPAAYTWRDDATDFTPGRLDIVAYTDSVMRVAKSFVLNTLEMSDADLQKHGLQREDVTHASDHLPLVVDFEPPTASTTTTTSPS